MALGIDTGMKDLDSQLEALWSVLDRNDLATFCQRLRAGTLTPEEFATWFPDDAFLLGAAILDSANVKQMKLDARASSHKQIDEIRQKAEQWLRPLLAISVVKRRLARLVQANANPADVALRPIGGVSRMHYWNGSYEAVTPNVRLGLVSKTGQVLLGSSLEWDDLFFLAAMLAEITAEALERSKPFADEGRISFGGPDQIAKRIQAMRANLQKTLELAPAFGIVLDTPTPTG